MKFQRSTRSIIAVAAVDGRLALAATACGDSDDEKASDTTAAEGSTTTIGTATADEVRLGFFPNVTHAPALVGVEEGFFEGKLGDTKLTTSTFNAGPEVIEVKRRRRRQLHRSQPGDQRLRVVERRGDPHRVGLDVRRRLPRPKPEITSATTSRAKVATPQLGNTQDVALRTWLKDEGLTTDTSGGGDVSIVPQANADTLTAFQNGDIAGAGRPSWWATSPIRRAAARRSSTKRPCGPRASTSRRTSSCALPSWTSTPAP